MNIILNYHERLTEMLSGGVARSVIGKQVGRYEWPAKSVPRVGEIVTVHPGANLEPSSESRTGKVTGVQHVFNRTHTAIVTIMDGA